MTYPSNQAEDQLKSFVRRIESVEDELAALNADKSEIYKEARSNGFDTKILRKVVAKRKVPAAERSEQEEIFDLYWDAVHGVAHAHVENIEEFGPDVVISDHTDSDGNRLKVVVDSRVAAILDKTSEPQPTKAAGSDLATPPANDDGQVADIQPVDPVRWEREPAGHVERHPYSKAFGSLGQDHHVIQDDIEGAKSDPIVMLGDMVLDGWARFNCATCTKTLTGDTTQYPVMDYDGTDPLIDCIKWNVAGRMMTEAERATVAVALAKAEPKRKADIYAAFELVA